MREEKELKTAFRDEDVVSSFFRSCSTGIDDECVCGLVVSAVTVSCDLNLSRESIPRVVVESAFALRLCGVPTLVHNASLAVLGAWNYVAMVPRLFSAEAI